MKRIQLDEGLDLGLPIQNGGGGSPKQKKNTVRVSYSCLIQ